MFNTTAFFHQSPSGGQKWSSNTTKVKGQSRSYHRINSLEGECHTHPKTTSKMMTANLDQKIQPTAKEEKWFNGHYNSNPPIHYPQQQHQQPHHPAFYNPYWPQQQQIQVPYNLNKGQFEIWPMEPAACQHPQQNFVDPHVAYITQGSMHYQSNNGTFTKCVNSLLDWGSAALATAATAITSSLLSGSPGSSTAEQQVCCSSTTLNPNAKEFVPLNPNAKEFTPKSSATQNIPVPDSIKKSSPKLIKRSSPEVSLKTVAHRKCTPWIPPGSSFGSFDDFELPERGEVSDSEDDSDDEDDDDSDEESHRNARARLLSQCSEDGFITFEESPKIKSPIDTKKCSQFLKDFLAGKGEEESEEEVLENDSDWDDQDQEPSVITIDENLLEECGLQCQWMVIESKPKTASTANDKLEKLQDTFPVDFDHDQVMQKIRLANQEWDKIPRVKAVKNEQPLEKTKDKVTFDLDKCQVVEEDPALADELRAARLGVNYAQLRADRDRYDRIIGPIFNEEHRDKMRSYIQRYLTDT